MMQGEVAIDSLVARVQRLEQRARWWQGICLICLLSAGAVLLFDRAPQAQAEPRANDEITATKVVLSDGNVKAVLTGSELVFYNKNEKVESKARLAKYTYDGLFLYNKMGEPQAQLYTSGGTAELRIVSENYRRGNQSEAHFMVNSRDGALLYLLDKDGTIMFKRAPNANVH